MSSLICLDDIGSQTPDGSEGESSGSDLFPREVGGQLSSESREERERLLPWGRSP